MAIALAESRMQASAAGPADAAWNSWLWGGTSRAVIAICGWIVGTNQLTLPVSPERTHVRIVASRKGGVAQKLSTRLVAPGALQPRAGHLGGAGEAGIDARDDLLQGRGIVGAHRQHGGDVIGNDLGQRAAFGDDPVHPH